MSDKFLAEKHLTKTPFLARLSEADQRRFYDSCCYVPRVNGVSYDLALEEPNMFTYDEDDPHLVPRDMVRHDMTDHGAQGQLYQELSKLQLPLGSLRIVRNKEPLT